MWRELYSLFIQIILINFKDIYNPNSCLGFNICRIQNLEREKSSQFYSRRSDNQREYTALHDIEMKAEAGRKAESMYMCVCVCVIIVHVWEYGEHQHLLETCSQPWILK